MRERTRRRRLGSRGAWLLALGLARLLGLGLPLLLPIEAVAQLRPEAFVADPGGAAQQQVKAELGPHFRVLETEHFRVVSDTSLRYHTVVAGVLEQFYQLVRPRFFERDIPRVDFFLIDGGREYETFMRERGLPNEAGYGLYDSRTRSLYARRCFPDGRESGVGTLFHEAVHAMVDANFANEPPRWFNEGFASLFEVGRVLRGQWVYGNPNPWRETPFRAAFEEGRVPALVELFATPDAAFAAPKPQRDLLYNSGRSLFLYVLRNHGESALADFVRRLQGGEPAAAALAEATGLELPELEQRWHTSIRELNFGGDYLNRATGADALPVLQEGARRHPAYGNLQLQLALQYLALEDYGRALEHAQLALADPHMIFRQQAHFVAARAGISTDPNAAAQSLRAAIAFQPWNEQVFGADYELLAYMFEKIGQSSRAAQLRDELEAMRSLDQR